MIPSQEKREYSRVSFTTRIDVTMDPNGENIALSVDSRDLSLRGVFAQTERKFSAGTPCDVVIYLTGSIEGIKLQIQGKVVRQDEAGVGIIFDAMDLDTYTHLKNIVRYNTGEDEKTAMKG